MNYLSNSDTFSITLFLKKDNIVEFHFEGKPFSVYAIYRDGVYKFDGSPTGVTSTRVSDGTTFFGTTPALWDYRQTYNASGSALTAEMLQETVNREMRRGWVNQWVAPVPVGYQSVAVDWNSFNSSSESISLSLQDEE